MQLKQVTRIAAAGIAASFVLFLINYPWRHIVQSPRMVASFAATILLYSSLLFFLISLHRRS